MPSLAPSRSMARRLCRLKRWCELDRDAVQRLEGVAQQQPLGLGVQGRALHAPGQPGRADLHAPETRVDVHVGGHADRHAIGIQHRERNKDNILFNNFARFHSRYFKIIPSLLFLHQPPLKSRFISSEYSLKYLIFKTSYSNFSLPPRNFMACYFESRSLNKAGNLSPTRSQIS